MHKKLLFLVLLLLPFLSFAQTLVSGKVESFEKENLEYCHIYNLSQKQGALSNSEGVFTIQAAVKDTIVISSLGYKNYTLVVAPINISNFNNITLEADAIALDEVIVGPNSLSGNIETDAKNIKTNNYDNFGFPHPKNLYKNYTPSQFTLMQAKKGFLEKIVYTLNGKYKQLRKNIALEKEETWVKFTEKLIDTSYYINELQLKEPEIVPFLFYLYEEKNTNEFAKKNEQLDLMQYMKLKVVDFKNQ